MDLHGFYLGISQPYISYISFSGQLIKRVLNFGAYYVLGFYDIGIGNVSIVIGNRRIYMGLLSVDFLPIITYIGGFVTRYIFYEVDFWYVISICTSISALMIFCLLKLRRLRNYYGCGIYRLWDRMVVNFWLLAWGIRGNHIYSYIHILNNTRIINFL